MNFTKEVPTRPGYYAWRHSDLCQVRLRTLTVEAAKLLTEDEEWAELLGGEWCRLVAADEVLAAFKEGVLAHETEWLTEWNESRAKRVMEGEE